MKKIDFKPLLPLLLFVIPIALIGGYFTGVYTLEHYTADIVDTILKQMPNATVFYIVIAAQSVVYAVIATVIGYFLAERTGLMKPFGFDKTVLLKVVPVIIVFGILFAGDYFTFARIIPQVAEDYDKGISAAYFIASLTYGGVVEEILLRWLFMSLIAWILLKCFYRNTPKELLPDRIYIVANVIAAVVFAAGHLPATQIFFGEITPIILFRCFLMNGGFALLFGRLYRKYGIQYAMLAHFGLHLISKLILIM